MEPGSVVQEGSGDAHVDVLRLADVSPWLVVELGRARTTLPGRSRSSPVRWSPSTGEPAELLVDGRVIARGQIVAVDESYGLQVTEVVRRS